MNEIEELKKEINTFCIEREWKQHHDPKNLALSLNLEAMEVLELFQWTHDNQVREDKIDELPKELADVFYWLILLSDHYDINLVEALREKMKENREKYPIEKARNSKKKYTEL